MVYAALIVQALFHVPQIRHRVANWRPAVPEGATEAEPPDSGPGDCIRHCKIVVPDSALDLLMWRLVETFTNMDLARLVDLDAQVVLEGFKPEPWSNPAQPPGELSYRAFL
jgi:hypothetical protein